jgi:hypothetical protein
MTQVGHVLTGTAIGVVCLPQNTSLRYKTIHFAAFVALSLVPDYRIQNWGHDRYNLIEFVTFAPFILLAIIFRNKLLKANE